MESHNTWPLMSNFFHLECFQALFMISMYQYFYSTFPLFIAEKYSTVWINHILSVHADPCNQKEFSLLFLHGSFPFGAASVKNFSGLQSKGSQVKVMAGK